MLKTICIASVLAVGLGAALVIYHNGKPGPTEGGGAAASTPAGGNGGDGGEAGRGGAGTIEPDAGDSSIDHPTTGSAGGAGGGDAFAGRGPAGFQGAGALRGLASPIAGPPYKLRWKYKAGDEEHRASIANNPTIAGKTVYVSDSVGVLHAIDLATGENKWKYKSEGGFETTPLVFEGRVYLGDLDGIFHCVSADKGEKVWSYDCGSGIHASANLAAAPDGKGHVLIFGDDGAEVLALTTDGKKAWEGKGGDRVNACPAVGFGVALFTGCDARLLAIDLKDGKERFAADLGGLAPGSPAVLEDRIIIGTGEGNVIALSPDGKTVMWKYAQVDQEGAMFYSSPAVDPSAGIAVIGCRDRLIHAVHVKDGKRAWAFKTRGEVDASPVISGGRVYVGSKDKKFYVLDLKTGEKVWEYTAARGIEAGAAIGAGVIVVGDPAGNVYCFEGGK